MLSCDLLSDTEFAEQAARAVDAFVAEHGCPKTVTRTQIYGLRQVARNQPTSVKQFADHQKKRAEKRSDEEQKRFWVCIEQLCDGRPPRIPWSLEQCAEKFMPADQVKKARQQWLSDWREEHYPQFFQRFCAHYLYRLGMKDE